jgi:hypothetical protein
MKGCSKKGDSIMKVKTNVKAGADANPPIILGGGYYSDPPPGSGGGTGGGV